MSLPGSDGCHPERASANHLVSGAAHSFQALLTPLGMESQLTLNSQWGPIRNVLNLWARFPPEQAERAKIKRRAHSSYNVSAQLPRRCHELGILRQRCRLLRKPPLPLRGPKWAHEHIKKVCAGERGEGGQNSRGSALEDALVLVWHVSALQPPAGLRQVNRIP